MVTSCGKCRFRVARKPELSGKMGEFYTMALTDPVTMGFSFLRAAGQAVVHEALSSTRGYGGA